MPSFTIDTIRARMLKLIEEHGSQRAAAAALSISQSHFCDILRGYRKPGPKTLKAMGLEETIIYRTRATV